MQDWVWARVAYELSRLVLFDRCSKKTGPRWVPDGSLVLRDDAIQVETPYGSQTYALFDHVTVIIQLKKSNEDLHANSLSFNLLEKVSASGRSGDLHAKGELDYLRELKKGQVVWHLLCFMSFDSLGYPWTLFRKSWKPPNHVRPRRTPKIRPGSPCTVFFRTWSIKE